MTEEGEQRMWKSIDERIAIMEENLNKMSKFARLFEERADENAMKICVQCFKEAYGKE
jgi:L-fucose isomerase-like protein